jgi:hypothetical protein|tara:strand:+ start:246 stop:770 length:525 start_codon:yes stop_codon:yes gene_type:complete
MGTKGPKAGNIFTSLKSRGLVGGQGQDPSIKGMGSPFKQTNGDGRDGSLYGSLKRAFKRNALKGNGRGNDNMDGPAPSKPNENSKAVLESEKKGDEAINDKMKATPLKQVDKKGTRIINQGEKAEAAYKAGNDKKGDRHKNRAKRMKDRDDAKKSKNNVSPLKKCGCGKKKCNC